MDKESGIPLTPQGRLTSSRRVGAPKETAPDGPAVADQVPTFGSRAPGASKGTIGKRVPQFTPTMGEVQGPSAPSVPQP
jgi:hypothetical protein